MRTSSFGSMLLSSWLTAIAAAQECGQPAVGFHSPGTDGTGSIRCSVVWDDGTGPALYVGGTFQSIGGVAARSVARWDGTAWTDIGANLTNPFGAPGAASALVVHNGSLYVGGYFASAAGFPAANLARYDGTTWSAVPGGGVSGDVNALASFQGQLYVGGFFSAAGGVSAPRIARFDGATWSYPSGGPYNDHVRALRVWDSGSGPRLYVGGGFVRIGSTFGPIANGIASTDGSSWSTLGTGLGNASGSILGTAYGFEVFDAGNGPRLFVGGWFSLAGGAPAQSLATWDGSAWSAFGGGIPGLVSALCIHDEGAGPKLFAAGNFYTAGGLAARNVARWDGANWAPLATGVGDAAFALGTFQGGLFAGGSFSEVDGRAVRGLARWASASWSSVGQGYGLPTPVLSFSVLDSGSGPELYAVTEGGPGGSTGPPRAFRWDGTGWVALGSGYTSGPIEASAAFDDGSGPALYVAGNFDVIGGVSARGFARWNGTSWSSPLATVTYQTRRLRVLDTGSGPALYAANTLTLSQHGVPTGSYLSRWTGTSWQPIGPAFSNEVEDMAIFDSGSGPEIYATGDFQTNGGTQLGFVARWDVSASQWVSLGGLNGSGMALAAHDDGGGAQLYVGGYFGSAGGMSALRIARWNGSAWSAAGSGFDGDHVEDLLVHDDGHGPRLFATGNFTLNGSRGFATWDGAQWESTAGLVTTATYPSPAQARTGVALASFDDGLGNGPDLWIGGEIVSLDGEIVENVGRIEGCGRLGAPICAGDGSGTACPCGNSSPIGSNAGCTNSLALAGTLIAQGSASLSNDTYVLAGSSMTNSSVLYFSGTASVNGGDGAAFGDGLRCAGGTVQRLGTTTNVGGASTQPNASQPTPLSLRGPIAPGQARFYQAWYRNSASFCTSAAFNLTNAWRVNWSA